MVSFSVSHLRHLFVEDLFYHLCWRKTESVMCAILESWLRLMSTKILKTDPTESQSMVSNWPVIPPMSLAKFLPHMGPMIFPLEGLICQASDKMIIDCQFYFFSFKGLGTCHCLPAVHERVALVSRRRWSWIPAEVALYAPSSIWDDTIL